MSLGIHAPRAVERCERLADLGPPPPWSRPWKLRRWQRPSYWSSTITKDPT